MRHGQWPYLDIWDRKPLGLFLLFAAIAGLFGPSILAMQGIAAVFAAATAWLIRAIALRFAGPVGAMFAALAYLLMLVPLGGQTAQSPLFYNLPVAAAFALLVGAVGKPAAAIRSRALLAMALSGIALTIKPVSVAEGAFFGMAFLFLLARAGLGRLPLLRTAAAMIGVALLPSLASVAIYAVMGPAALDAYVHANFVSIFDKGGLGSDARLAGIGYVLLFLGPLLLFAIIGLVRRDERRPLDGLLAGWVVAALVGYLLVPNFFDHYALPLLPPLCVAAARLFDRRDGWMFFAVVAVTALLQGDMFDRGSNLRERAEMAAIGREIERARAGGCLFVAEGPAWLYAQSPACRPTAYQFPGHLTLGVEARALGVEQFAELARVLDQRPAVIVTRENERDQRSKAVDALLQQSLSRSYRPVALLPVDSGPLTSTLTVWQRRDIRPR